ncbi:MAG: NAD(P)/FAD-dependent oxidoreductase [Candidatus Bathyarchaeia archaeon]
MGKQILILGAGFGGLSVAHTLRSGLGSDHKVTIVDKQPLFFMGLTKLWVLNGTRQVGDGPGNRTLLAKKGVDFIEGEVRSIDVAGKEVIVNKRKLGFDYLVIALGADYSPASTPGFLKYATNLYTESGCAEIRDKLRSVTSGIITILVCGLPFKCPPAPYESSMIIDDILRKKGGRENVKLQVVTPEPQPLTILGAEAGMMVTRLLEERGIEYHPSERVKEVRSRSVLTEGGKEISHDLLFGIPTHVSPSVLREAGLTDQSGWIPVNARTLATSYPQVYAIGDCAGPRTPKGQLLPRAGILAEGQGKVVAANLIHEIKGATTREEFQGNGVCFMEVGGGRAAPVRARFYAEPNPTWESTPPSAEGLREKQLFLEERMSAWFR